MNPFDQLDAAFADQFSDRNGLTPKQEWWAGYRAGKGCPPNTPRTEAISWPNPPDSTQKQQGEPDVQV